MIRINLAPPEILHKQKQTQHILQASAAGVVVVFALVMVSVAHMRRASALETQFTKLEAEHKSLQSKVNEVNRLHGEISVLKAKLKAIRDLLKGRLTYPKFMAAFLEAMPGEVWIKTMSANISPGERVGFRVSASSLNSESVADWVQTLEESPQFSKVNLGAISIGADEGVRELKFSLQGDFQGK